MWRARVGEQNLWCEWMFWGYHWKLEVQGVKMQ